MTRTEREALEAVLEEHGQTRRPVSPSMIAIACNVLSSEERAALKRAVDRLTADGLLVKVRGGWAPTPKTRAALNQPLPHKAEPKPQTEPMESGFKQRRALRDKTANQVDETAEQASAKRQAAFQEWKRENTPPPAIPAELLDRCAAMHLTLLEQARKEYAEGNERAGRELAWLIETGEQLVAAGGEAA